MQTKHSQRRNWRGLCLRLQGVWRYLSVVAQVHAIFFENHLFEPGRNFLDPMFAERKNKLEIIANLWYVKDNEGFIYSLRARLYIQTGTDEQKLAYLKKHAKNDYLIAQPFPVPEKWSTNFISSDGERKMPVAHLSFINSHGGPQIMFEDIYSELEKQLPAQTIFKIPDDPLIVITPLFPDENGLLFPHFTGTQKL